MKEAHQEASPVSFPVHVARLPRTGMPVVIEADAAQRAALAQMHGLAAVESWRADLLVEPWKRNGIRISGSVHSAIVQECIVTLDPLTAVIHEPVEGLFLPEDSKLGREGFGEGGEILLDADGPDSPETFSGETIDAGAFAEEYFGLAIDPYPRKPGVALPEKPAGEGEPVADWQQKLRRLAKKG